MKPKLLIVDDDEVIRTQMKMALGQDYDLLLAADRPSAVEHFRAAKPAVVLLDLGLPPHAGDPEEGLAALSELLGIDRLAKVVIISGQGEKKNVLQAIGAGAYDFLDKPADVEELKLLLKRCFYVAQLEREFHEVQNLLQGQGFEGMLGTSPQIQKVFDTIRKVATTDAPVLILGESGTGKELAARAIHLRSARKDGPFVAINCSAIPETLLESELFGHEKGAFTGALDRRLGKFELADSGTLFLDEVGDIPLDLQTKLLRVLQDHEYSRVGGRDVMKADVRILAATNQDLDKAVKEKRFREDLYFRLKVIPIYLPPLRERRGDIPLLIGYFVDKINREMGIQISGVSPEAQKLLEEHTWPGNVRELENTLIRAAVLSSGPIMFPKDFTLQNKPATTTLEVDQLSLEEIIRHKLEDYFRRTEGVDVDNLYSLVIERVERPLIELTLKKTKGNQIRAAQILGINRNTLRKKITDLRIELKKEPS